MPGSSALQSLISGLAFWALLASLGGLLISAAVWALSSHSGNYQHSALVGGARSFLLSRRSSSAQRRRSSISSRTSARRCTDGACPRRQLRWRPPPPASARVVLGIAALALLGVGLLIGSHIAGPRGSSVVQATVTEPSSASASRPPAIASPNADTQRCGHRRIARHHCFQRRRSARPEPSPSGRSARIASAESRVQPRRPPSSRRAQRRVPSSVPEPSLGPRDRASISPSRISAGALLPRQATVAVWYVGIVGSGATVQPQQSWRTEVVSLVWESGTWKVSAFRSAYGPTPPLSTAEIPATPGQLFAAIPGYDEFSRNEPSIGRGVGPRGERGARAAPMRAFVLV